MTESEQRSADTPQGSSKEGQGNSWTTQHGRMEMLRPGILARSGLRSSLALKRLKRQLRTKRLATTPQPGGAVLAYRVSRLDPDSAQQAG